VKAITMMPHLSHQQQEKSNNNNKDDEASFASIASSLGRVGCHHVFVVC
jgi:hypothetical protein